MLCRFINMFRRPYQQFSFFLLEIICGRFPELNHIKYFTVIIPADCLYVIFLQVITHFTGKRTVSGDIPAAMNCPRRLLAFVLLLAAAGVRLHGDPLYDAFREPAMNARPCRCPRAAVTAR